MRHRENTDSGGPVHTAQCFHEERVDEIVFYDSTTLIDQRDIMMDRRETGRI